MSEARCASQYGNEPLPLIGISFSTLQETLLNRGPVFVRKPDRLQSDLGCQLRMLLIHWIQWQILFCLARPIRGYVENVGCSGGAISFRNRLLLPRGIVSFYRLLIIPGAPWEHGDGRPTATLPLLWQPYAALTFYSRCCGAGVRLRRM